MTTNRYADGLRDAAKLVPQNWEDPILTGAKGVILNLGVILNAVRERIEAAAREAEKPKKRKRAKGRK
jgi:hypothetical protein